MKRVCCGDGDGCAAVCLAPSPAEWRGVARRRVHDLLPNQRRAILKERAQGRAGWRQAAAARPSSEPASWYRPYRACAMATTDGTEALPSGPRSTRAAPVSLSIAAAAELLVPKSQPMMSSAASERRERRPRPAAGAVRPTQAARWALQVPLQAAYMVQCLDDRRASSPSGTMCHWGERRRRRDGRTCTLQAQQQQTQTLSCSMQSDVNLLIMQASRCKATEYHCKSTLSPALVH